MAVKVEPEGDVSEQEIIELKPVQEHGSKQEFVQVAVAKALGLTGTLAHWDTGTFLYFRWGP